MSSTTRIPTGRGRALLAAAIAAASGIAALTVTGCGPKSENDTQTASSQAAGPQVDPKLRNADPAKYNPPAGQPNHMDQATLDMIQRYKGAADAKGAPAAPPAH